MAQGKPIGRIITLFLLTLALAACEKEKSEAPPAFEDLIDEFDATLSKHLERAAFEDAERERLSSLLREPKPHLESQDGLRLRHVDALRDLYRSREHSLAWANPDVEIAGLTPAGESLYAAILDAEPRHGLWAEDFHVDTIGKLLSKTGDPSLVPLEGLSLTRKERSTLRAILAENPELAAEGAAGLAQASATGKLGLSRLHEAVATRKKAIQMIAATKARMDLLLSDALVEYGVQMRWGNSANHQGIVWSEELRADASPSRELTRKRTEHLVRERLQPVFEDTERVHSTVASLVPEFEQYARLSEAFQSYSRLAEGEKWPTIPKDAGKLSVGHENEYVVLLKKRLAAEGYWKGDEGPTFTRALRSALLEYQRTHQLWEEGRLTDETRRSLNIPSWRRLDQIRLTLQRYRESRVGPDNYYVHVNVPDFHAEVWDDGKRTRRFKIVTGSTARKWNEKLEKNVFVNATPRFSSEMKHVVFNPYWNVPDGIRKSEIEPKLKEDPFYFMDQGFEYITEESGRVFLRQNPGPENALGIVKFLFPNQHDVYMHDTPDKEYFKWPIRAFSHGCVRVEDPMALAQHLLERDGRWDEEKVTEWLERDTETWIRLDQPVPVHIEYYVVRVDDLGRTNFLADVYQLDGPRLDEIKRRRDARRDAAEEPEEHGDEFSTTAIHP